jgi:regulatory protein
VSLEPRDTERAIERAYRAIAHRERTVAELRAFLARKRTEPEVIEDAVDELTAAGVLDDARYARRFAEDKRELERWGTDRIARDLQRRGVADHLIDAALAGRGRESELATAVLVLEQRVPPPRDDRDRDRAWRLLVRRGYPPELAYEAVRLHERASDDRRRAA